MLAANFCFVFVVVNVVNFAIRILNNYIFQFRAALVWRHLLQLFSNIKLYILFVPNDH
jgi:hypothetical protein